MTINFEIYTDRAHRVMELARQFAKQSGSDVVGTEHLLYALVQEGHGVAAFVLREAGLTLKVISDLMNVYFGSRQPSEVVPKLTPHLLKVLGNADKEANKLGHKYIGTEHLLLGLLTIDVNTSLVARNILKDRSIDEKTLIDDVLRILGIAPKHITETLIEKIVQEDNPQKEFLNGVKWAIKMYLNNFDGKFYDRLAQFFGEYGFTIPRMTSPAAGIHSKLEIVLMGNEFITPVDCVLIAQAWFKEELRASTFIKELRLLRITDDIDLMPATKI